MNEAISVKSTIINTTGVDGYLNFSESNQKPFKNNSIQYHYESLYLSKSLMVTVIVYGSIGVFFTIISINKLINSEIFQMMALLYTELQ